MEFLKTVVLDHARERSRKKTSGHGRFGGDGAWKQHQRRHVDDWEANGREAKDVRRAPMTIDVAEALNEARVDIADRELAQLLASQTVVAASYDPRYGLQTYCERATVPRVTRVATPAATKAKRRHRGGRKHRNNQQRFTIAA